MKYSIPETTKVSMPKRRKMKPCPFCGAKANLAKDGTIFAWHKSDCFFTLMEYDDKNKSIEEITIDFAVAWNRRE